jgi:hypothetical protein
MKNLRELFNLYHAGFQDFGPWLDHHREMHRRHPLDVPEFGAEWLRRWEVVGRLLEAQSVRECQLELSRAWYAADNGTVAQMLRQCTRYDLGLARRVSLLDGTIIREWGPK